jgi:hypothetical protein
MKKKRKDKRVLVVLIHHKCKVSQVWVAWVAWVDSLEWVGMIEMKMMNNKEILMILKNRNK